MPLNYYDDAPTRWDSHEAHRVEQLRCNRDQLARELEIAERARKTAEAAVDKLLEATGGAAPEYQRQDAFTICVLVDPVSERVFTGAACCGKHDTFNLEIGKAISLGRAMNQRAEYFASAAYAK